jgi:hypothetical protein
LKKLDGKVLNRNRQGDEGEWTYVGSRGETLIFYGIVNQEAWERVEFKIGKRIELGHLPQKISKEERNHKKRRKGRAKEEQKKVTIKIWDDQGVEEYRRRLEKAIFEE